MNTTHPDKDEEFYILEGEAATVRCRLF